MELKKDKDKNRKGYIDTLVGVKQFTGKNREYDIVKHIVNTFYLQLDGKVDSTPKCNR